MTPEEQAVITTSLDYCRAVKAIHRAWDYKNRLDDDRAALRAEQIEAERSWMKAKDANQKAITALGEASGVIA